MHRLRQLTFGPYGHTLNRRQSVSPCGNWIAYDTRNDDSHLAKTRRIEMVHVDTGQVVCLYDTASRQEFGPGVGAVAFHPSEQKVVFIHGLQSCTATAPYSGARRFGAILEIERPGIFQHAESRCLTNQPAWKVPFGCLSGGTHAHSWNQRGYISFTYNDVRLEKGAQEKTDVRDLRTIGFMLPGAAHLQHMAQSASTESHESFPGTHMAFLAANVCANPVPGSDEVSAALEECWIGELGYTDANGSRVPNALAFQGTLLDETGKALSEVFVSDLPSEEHIAKQNDSSASSILTGSNDSVQHFVCNQRRLTYTQSRLHPGISGPRHWLASSKSGDRVYCLMRDNRGIVQLHFVSVLGGEAIQITDLPSSITSQFNLNRASTKAVFLCDNRLVEADLETGTYQWLTPKANGIELIASAQYLLEERFICNGIVSQAEGKFIQAFVAE